MVQAFDPNFPLIHFVILDNLTCLGFNVPIPKLYIVILAPSYFIEIQTK